MFEPLFTPLFSSLFSPLIDPAQRVFIDLDPVLESHYTIQNPVVESGDFEISLDVYTASNSSLQTLIGTPTGSDSFFRLDNISTSAVIKVKLGGVELPIPAATLTLNKLHNLRISRVGTTFTVHVDGAESGSETNAVWGADFEIGKIGTLGSNLQFFNGIIANVDLGNGNAWQLNRELPATTEQSTGGTNLLTYVGAPKTELFTFINGRWIGVDKVVNGRFDTGANWTLSGAVISGGVAIISGGANGFISQMLDVSNGDFVELVYTITSTSAAGELFLSSSGFGDIAQGLDKTVGTHAVAILVLDDAAPLKILHNTADAISIDNVSVNRFIQIA